MTHFKLLKITLFSLLISSFLFFSCRQKVSKEEGEKQFRAFDNELIIMSKQLTETHAYRLLLQLNTIENLPLPFQFRTSFPGKPYRYNFEMSKGIYRYNKEKNEMYKSAPSDSIVLFFPYRSEVDSMAKMIITAYADEQTVWDIMLPVKMEAKIFLGEHAVFNLYCQGEIKHELPIDYLIEMEFSRFKIKSTLNTKLSKKKGRVHTNVSILKDKTEVFKFESSVIARINEDQQFDFGLLKLKAEVFPIVAGFHINRDKIDKYSTHFINDFNENSSIWIYGNRNRTIIGKVELKDRPNNDRLNPAIIYNDGSIEYLDDFLFSIAQILNVKY